MHKICRPARRDGCCFKPISVAYTLGFIKLVQAVPVLQQVQEDQGGQQGLLGDPTGLAQGKKLPGQELLLQLYPRKRGQPGVCSCTRLPA